MKEIEITKHSKLCADLPKALPTEFYSLLHAKTNSVLLETARFDSENFQSFLFVEPIDVLNIFSLDEVPYLFSQIEKLLAEGFYLAGYFAYECGFHFEDIILDTAFGFPIAWFGVYKKPIVFDHIVGKMGNFVGTPSHNSLGNEYLFTDYSINDIIFNLSKQPKLPTRVEYVGKIEKIKEYIRSGEVYQINFTGRVNFNFEGSEITFYDALKKKQKVSYGAFIQTDHNMILSLSPELFFRRSGNKIITRPMKGTIHRGRTLQEDDVLKKLLSRDEKSKAENVMIVDVLRNDLGKISKIGSVITPSLFSVEKYDTLFQMTSTVESQLHSNVKYYDIFKALFPSGSVTGAPKIRSMQLINELEGSQRGIYTGAIGYFSPANKAVFNVAIRTISLHNSRGEMGTGGGIVWDSNPEDEYRECELKTQFLRIPYEDFSLIETMLWHNGYLLLEKHKKRLSESAKYFDFPCDFDFIIMKLSEVAQGFDQKNKYKVRLTLNRLGYISIENSVIVDEMTSGTLSVTLSPIRTDSEDVFLYHKTTKRPLYEKMFQQATITGFTDVIFMNESDQITEGAISNVLIEKDGVYFTPPVHCGLLNGVYRQHLLETVPNIKETQLYLKDLTSADAVYICNAIKGVRKVKFTNGGQLEWKSE